jgi:transcriptional regulator with XRE-family HTH domain
VAYNPSILREALKARSLTEGQLSSRLGIELRELEKELRREPEPRQGLLNDIAKELSPSALRLLYGAHAAPP